jgi:predicted small secreted protein
MKAIRQFWEALALSLFLALAGLAMAGCEEGPFERAGENIDEAGDEIEDAADEAGDEIEDAIEDARD